MKNKLLSILILVLLACSCSDLNLSPDDSLKTEELNVDVSVLPPGPINNPLRLSLYNILSTSWNGHNYLLRGGNTMYFNHERIGRDIGASMQSKFNITGLSFPTFVKGVDPTLKPVGMNALPSSIPNISKVFTKHQLYIMDNFYGIMYNFENYSDEIIDQTYQTAKTQIAQTYEGKYLTTEESRVVQSVIELGYVFVIRYRAEGYTPTFPGASQMACRINVKGVLQSAVISGAGHAIYGAYMGFTAGTVAFPVIGTVTGAAGSAAAGFALGFIRGAGAALVEQGIFNCLFGVSTPPDPNACTKMTTQAAIAQCLAENADRKYWFLLR